jgi:hypothetical protein
MPLSWHERAVARKEQAATDQQQQIMRVRPSHVSRRPA